MKAKTPMHENRVDALFYYYFIISILFYSTVYYLFIQNAIPEYNARCSKNKLSHYH